MTDQLIIESWILIALGARSQGMAKRKYVLDDIEARLVRVLKPDDLPWRRYGEMVWRNKVAAARNVLGYKGLVEPTVRSGKGEWVLTPRGAARAASLAADFILCPFFRLAAIETSERLRRGSAVGLAPGETTLTDNALLDLAAENAASVRIQRFTASQEGRNGADWEWWIRDRNGFVGFRIQAKRVNPLDGKVAIAQRAAKSLRPFFPRQIDAFAERCRLDGIPGLYCIYGDGRSAPVDASAGRCPHGPDNCDVWGCTALLTDTAMRLADERVPLDGASVMAAGVPWHRLVCAEGVASSPTVSVSTAFSQMHEAERRIRRQAQQRRDDRPDEDRPYELPVEPPLATEPPEDILRYFQQWDGPMEHPRSDALAGVTLIDATRHRNGPNTDFLR